MLVWLRRVTQAAFFVLFLWVFIDTAYHPVNRAGALGELFFDLDPLTLLATRTAAWLPLLVLATALLAGRWFCGWLCPFGAVHNLFTSLRKFRAKARIAIGGYSPWQRTKYYILIAFVAAALAGVNLAGWLDPFSLFFRSLAVVIFPVFQDGMTAPLAYIYERDPHLGPLHLTSATEPVYETLRRHVFAPAQPHFYGSAGIALVFVAAVLLNFFRARFWCRSVCPLGALLGCAGKNPLVRIERRAEDCNHCGLCVADCQGGASPDGDWKPAECLYCGNCRPTCPQHALGFAIRRDLP